MIFPPAFLYPLNPHRQFSFQHPNSHTKPSQQKPAIMEVDRIFSAEQIEVHPELPSLLKDYTKAVIRANPVNLLAFSAEYFRKKADIPGDAVEGSAESKNDPQDN